MEQTFTTMNKGGDKMAAPYYTPESTELDKQVGSQIQGRMGGMTPESISQWLPFVQEMMAPQAQASFQNEAGRFQSMGRLGGSGYQQAIQSQAGQLQAQALQQATGLAQTQFGQQGQALGEAANWSQYLREPGQIQGQQKWQEYMQNLGFGQAQETAQQGFDWQKELLGIQREYDIEDWDKYSALATELAGNYKSSDWSNILSGVGAGSAFGPWGAVAGGVAGYLGNQGWFG